ncbi:hypothetical protein PRK78_005482 [Emydomyces testavorans]|uniref:Uncharacterized protein n=1 Tax=Emydomyces testavorans TaxID=2070801 RepID=A0AAF0DJQ9_9EURO|nr:hypothetical protein PRK78_005482 [Emydomyces testavorans]
MSTPVPPASDRPGVSPASLLWAHQLRREHKALVEQIVALESSVEKGKKETSHVKENIAALHGTVQGLEKVIGEMRSEIAMLRYENAGVKSVAEGLVEEAKAAGEERTRWEEGVKRATLAMQESLEARLMEEVGRLREEVEEMKREAKSRPTPEILSRPRDLTLSVPPAAQPSPQGTNCAQHRAYLPSTISGTPSTRSSRCVTRSASIELIPESFPLPPPGQFASVSAADFTQISSIIPSARQHSPCPPSNQAALARKQEQEREDSLQTLEQNSLSLSRYLELGESVLSKYPRRRDEYRVVQAFWEGLSDSSDQKVIEARLECDGWSWEVLRVAVGDLMAEKEEDLKREEQKKKRSQTRNDAAKTGPNASNRGQKRRRVIPIVWSTKEEEEEWLAQSHKWLPHVIRH